MPDDERSRRRLGDATKSRIADLASGWSVDAPPSPEPPLEPTAPDALDTDPVATVTPSPDDSASKTLLPPPPSAMQTAPAKAPPAPLPQVPTPGKSPTHPPPLVVEARPKAKVPTLPPPASKIQAPVAAPAPADEPAGGRPRRKTNPPPPPGSPERKALEEKIVATRTRDDDATEEVPPERRRTTTGSQPVAQQVVGRPKIPTGAQPAVPAGRPRVPTGSQPVAGRAKPPTQPPPPPGTTADGRPRVPTGSQPVAADGRPRVPTGSQPVAGRAKPPTQPPPPPGSPERSKPPSVPPAGPKFPRAGNAGPLSPLATRSTDAEDKPFSTEARTPAVIVDTAAFAGNTPPATAGELAAKPTPTVPIGEFDAGLDTMKQITAKRDPAEALLKIPDQETPVDDLVDDDDRPRDATSIDPATNKFERGDPTNNAPPDATEIQAPGRVKQMTGGTLRRHAALRRKRGLYGDVRYVFTALFGVRRARREIGELEHRQELRATSRKRQVITLGRAAATMENFDHPALGPARDTLALIEDERAKHQGAVAASDAELDRVRRDRETNTRAHVESLAKCDAEIAEITKKIDPLEKEAAGVRKKSSELRDELHRIDKKIADTEALLVSVKGEKLDKAGVQADIATLKANRQAVAKDEPALAAELDGLNPRIAALEATRNELTRKKVDLEKADQDDQRRTLELLEAIGAKRKVVERASADAEVARDNALFELGDRLYVDRPQALGPQLSPIDRIDLEIGEDERRAMELKEILSNIDKAKFARGLAMIILALGAVGSLVWLILSLT